METTTNDKQPMLGKGLLVSFIMLTTCFALWGILNNMTDTLVPAFAKIFMIEAVDSALVQVAFYGAYAVLAIPAAMLIKKWSYRSGILVGLGFYAIGAMGYIPAAALQSYSLFLVSIFILAGGLSVLETTCNPFVLALGPKETAVQRLNFAQAFNPLGSITGLFLAKYVILANLNPASVQERGAMDAQQLASIRDTELFWLSAPYIGLILIAAVIWVYFFRHKSGVKDESGELNMKANAKTLFGSRPYVFGVIAQFFYIGAQISVWTWAVLYAKTLWNVDEAEAVKVSIWAIYTFIIMRWVCTALMRVLRPSLLMTAFALLGIAFSIGTVYLPTSYSIPCLIALSGCMSLMFPTIYGLALGRLGGEETKLGAAGLIMAIAGGAIIPTLMGSIIDGAWLTSLLPMYEGMEACIRSSYYVSAVCFSVILAYSVYMVRYENRND